METKLLNIKGEEVGTVGLSEKVFSVKPNRELLHEVTTIYLANQRRGQAHTKTRTEVSGGGRKPWKQKHTGRARAGSNRSPLWRHGGIAHGPRRHSHRLDLPRAKAQTALLHALSARAAEGSLVVLDGLALDGAKTRQVAELLAALGARPKSLLVIEAPDKNLVLASRNIADLKIMLPTQLNAYAVLNCHKLIVTKGALEKLSTRWN
ncbi:MAG: 50S ribosomal protein L4 [Elusimicrobia bacterium]|nr:50S ribosomal protein L4 [Elusimicrobiota bacterium]